MTLPEHDWSYDRDGDDVDIEYDQYDKVVGGLIHGCLGQLSLNVRALETDAHGWTAADSEALDALQEIDILEPLLVPPATTPMENRQAFKLGMATFYAALPFTESERRWLLVDPELMPPPDAIPVNEAYVTFIRQTEGEIMSAGIVRVVQGRDLLQRWWSWRREIGEYAGQGSLDRARDALKNTIGLLTPELGLPEAYAALRHAKASVF